MGIVHPSVSLLLPRSDGLIEARGGRTYVAAVDPRALLDDRRLAELAEEAATKLPCLPSPPTRRAVLFSAAGASIKSRDDGSGDRCLLTGGDDDDRG